MSKLNVTFDENRMNISREKVVDNVMNRIQLEKRPSFSFRIFTTKRLAISFGLVLVLSFVFMFDFGSEGTIQIQAYESEEIARSSYLSGSIISMATTEILASSNILPVKLAYTQNVSTSFEGNIHEFHKYFDTLRLYMDDVDISSVVSFETLLDHEFDYKLSYVLDNQNFIFYINQNKNSIGGELHIGTTIYIVEGYIKESKNEFELGITAYNGENYVKVEYINEIDDELERTYMIEQSVGGIITRKEISIEIDGLETTVQMKSNDGNYEMNKVIINGIEYYEISYEIGETEGEVVIQVNQDEFGNEVFSYHIYEDGLEVDLDLYDPDEYDEDEPDEEEPDEEELDEL